MLQSQETFPEMIKQVVKTMIGSDTQAFWNKYSNNAQGFFDKFNNMRGPYAGTTTAFRNKDDRGPLIKIITLPKDWVHEKMFTNRTFKHEFLHSIGLKHPNEGNIKDERLDCHSTIMGKDYFQTYMPEFMDTLQTQLNSLNTANLSPSALIDKLSVIMTNKYRDYDIKGTLTDLDKTALNLTAKSFNESKPHDAKLLAQMPLISVKTAQPKHILETKTLVMEGIELPASKRKATPASEENNAWVRNIKSRTTSPPSPIIQ